MAEADTNTPGGCFRQPSASESKRVDWTLLSRILVFFRVVHLPAMVSPARCTTASVPSSSDAFRYPPSGSQQSSPPSGPGFDSGRDRTRRVTECPAAVREATTADPTNPLDPV